MVPQLQQATHHSNGAIKEEANGGSKEKKSECTVLLAMAEGCYDERSSKAHVRRLRQLMTAPLVCVCVCICDCVCVCLCVCACERSSKAHVRRLRQLMTAPLVCLWLRLWLWLCQFLCVNACVYVCVYVRVCV